MFYFGFKKIELCNGIKPHLKKDFYEVFKCLYYQQIREELEQYEEMLINLNSIVRDDPVLHSIAELTSVLDSTNEEDHEKKRKKQRKSSTNHHHEEKSSPRSKENNDIEKDGSNHVKKSLQNNERLIEPEISSEKLQKRENSVQKDKNSNPDKVVKKIKRRRKSKIKNKDINNILESIIMQNPNKATHETKNSNSRKDIKKSDTFISIRKKENQDSLNYNLRGQIKAASKLKYDWLQDNLLSQKHKTKTLSDPNKFLTTEEFVYLF